MNKCEHNEKISMFCASQCCVWREAGGCEVCMKKYHNHMGPTIFLNEHDISCIVKKYSMDHSIKPKCRLLQQAIFNYFTLIKTEFTASIDIACKNIINQIGYPFLYANNTLSTYKRLKNKQYKKLLQKQFRLLYDLTQKIQEKDLAKEQSVIYVTEMKKAIQLLNCLDENVKRYQQILKYSNPSFQHDPTSINRINQIAKSLHSESPSKHSKIKQWPILKSNSLLSKNVIQKVDAQFKQIILQQKTQEQIRNQRQQNITINNNGIRYKDSRDISLDKKMIKEHTFNYYNDKTKHQVQKKVQTVQKVQKVQKEKPIINQQVKMDEKFQKLKTTLQNKEIQINQKKKMLIEMMKQKQQSLKSAKEAGATQKDKNDRPTDRLDIPSIFKQTNHSTLNYQPSSHNYSQLYSDLNTVNHEPTSQHYAFNQLPFYQPQHKSAAKQQVRKKVIVVSTLSGFKDLHLKFNEIQSPLIKKKNIINKFQQIKLKQSVIIQSQQKEQNVGFKKVADVRVMQIIKKEQKREQILQLKECQQRSIELMLKSLTVKGEQAIGYLQQCLDLADNNLSAAQYLSYLYLQANKPKECLQLCNKILQQLQQSNESEEVLLNINNNKTAALNMLGRYSQSILILERCLRFKQTQTLFKNLADAYFSISIYQKAVYNYQKVIRINQAYDQAYYNLAVCLYIQQNFYNAKLSIRKAIDIQPNNKDYLELQANIQTKILHF